jgi:hypothetical protein
VGQESVSPCTHFEARPCFELELTGRIKSAIKKMKLEGESITRKRSQKLQAYLYVLENSI